MTKELKNIIEMTQRLNEAVRGDYGAYISVSVDNSYILLHGENEAIAQIVMSYPGAKVTYNKDTLYGLNYLYTSVATQGIALRSYTKDEAVVGEHISVKAVDQIIALTKDIRAAVIQCEKTMPSDPWMNIDVVNVTVDSYHDAHILLNSIGSAAAKIVLGLPGATSEYIPDEWSNLNYRYVAVAAPGIILTAYTENDAELEAVANG